MSDAFFDDIDAMIDGWLERIERFGSDPADGPPPDKPPGNCTTYRHYALRLPIIAYCKGFRAQGCHRRHNCSDLRQRLFWRMKCAAARNNMNRECYNGGNIGHAIAQRQAALGAKRCTTFLRQRSCRG